MDSLASRIEAELIELQADTEFQRKFNRLMNLCYETASLKGWHTPSKSFGEQVLMMHSELSEVVEAYRENGYMHVTWDMTSFKPEGIPIELADLSIREFDTCTMYNINLLDAIFTKMKFNLTRPYRHGDKLL